MPTYHHTQRAPLCLLLYGLAITFLVLTCVLRQEPVLAWVFPVTGLIVLVLAAAFHHLTVVDGGDHLSISFGPLPLFHRTVRYDDVEQVEVGKTTLLDGWGIHMSIRDGWVWNLWGCDCVVLRLRNGTLRVGTDDAENLRSFIVERKSEEQR
ncbi:hypothetical protein ETAA8_09370 [Anatilimnocola aggregata]|uniref:Uncharacterized protein n=1 Tax=Anatilimnocola aggregata TaxID=2528021 RepID=A0A517Y6L1_9BACT|nr:hypothetical protein [Anatilimnocola aggregata]QDU25865.1 hypothetical protein ETAA8_09370 [Anatilimnocola aggregata]